MAFLYFCSDSKYDYIDWLLCKNIYILYAGRKFTTMNWKRKTALFLVGLILLAASPWVLLECKVISVGWAIVLVVVIPGIIMLSVWSLIRKSGKEHPEDIMDAAARKHGRWFSGVVIPFRLSFYLKMILTSSFDSFKSMIFLLDLNNYIYIIGYCLIKIRLWN